MMELVSLTSAEVIWMMLDSDVQKVSDTLTNTAHKYVVVHVCGVLMTGLFLTIL